LKAEKPKIFHIAKYPPPIGRRVKVWFDTKERQLLVGMKPAAAALIKHGHLKSITVVNPINRCPTVVVPAKEVERFERE
jgi:hypothetical protein